MSNSRANTKGKQSKNLLKSWEPECASLEGHNITTLHYI